MTQQQQHEQQQAQQPDPALPSPLTRWQALAERWAVLRSRALAWWAGVDGRRVSLGALMALLVGVSVVAVLWMGPAADGSLVAASRRPSVDSVGSVGAGVVADAGVPGVLQVEPILLGLDRRLAVLEARAGLPVAVAVPAAVAGRGVTSSFPVPARSLVPSSVPLAGGGVGGAGVAGDLGGGDGGGVWGATDLDRSIADFSPSDSFGALK